MHMTQSRTFTQRMLGAARLETAVYEEVEHDEGATIQAAGVVGIVAAASAIGSWGASVASGFIAPFVGWLVMAAVVYIIGDKLLGGTATWGEMLRTMGFAQAPGVLYVVGIIPLLGWVVSVVVWFWVLVAAVVAIRQGMDFGTGRAVVTGLLAVIPAAILTGLIMAVF